jgi:cell division protein FtsL
MKPRTAILLLAASVAMGYGVYKAKYEVRELKVQAGNLRQQIGDDQEAIEVLKVEWAYLTRPTRLEELSKRYLKLGAMKPEQAVPMTDIEVALAPREAAAPERKLASVGRGGR